MKSFFLYVYQQFPGVMCVATQLVSVVLMCLPTFLSDLQRGQLIDQGQGEGHEFTDTKHRDLSGGSFCWEIPVALTLVSIGYWENFLNTDIKIFRYLNE